MFQRLSHATIWLALLPLFVSCSMAIKPSPEPLAPTHLTETVEPSLEEILEANCFEGLPSGSASADEQWRELDLWDRILHGYDLPKHEHKKVTQQLNWFKKHPEYIDRVTKRGGRYLYYIVSELEARDMPMEIAFLPIVESAFDPFAYSPSRASGMWQIIPGTGKMLGLKQTWWYDGRRDAVASTDAALTYLQRLNRRFDGDWLLTLASYNSGAGTVNRAIRKNKKRGKPTDFWHLELPRETRDYVPKLIALARLFEAPEQYGINLHRIENKPYFAAVDVEGQIDLAQAAVLAEISMDDLYVMNAGFNRWATDPDGPHSLLVPIAQAETFQSGLNSVPANQRVRWQRHRIQEGETLSHIASKYNISVASLQSINNLRNSNIRAGKMLMVPTAQQGSKHYSYSTDQRRYKKQNAGAKPNKTRIDHVVRSGESFWKIGKTYGVNSSSVAKWNNMAPRDPLKVGQKLVVWVDKNNARNGTSLNFPPSDQVIRKLSYRVRKGDSLHKIASKFSVAVNDIVKWNAIQKNGYLQPGQSLTLYVDVKS